MLKPLWWLAYAVAGIWCQSLAGGVDFLAPGLVLALQQEGVAGVVWLTLLFMFVQEGLGGLAFGYGFAWYGGLLVFYGLGRWLFDQKSFLFVCLCGLAMGLWHVAVTLSLAGLEDLTVSLGALSGEAALQAALFPVAWWLAHLWYPDRFKVHERPA